MGDEQLPSLPQEGDLIGGRFRITELLGSGGFGTVYRALQENVGRDVALKFLAPSVAKDPVNIERFRREAFHVSQLRHPNTITLYDYGQTESGLFFMVMELLEGVALSEQVQKHGPIEKGRAAHIFLQVLKSLSEAHQRGLVHRDLKPENIYLCEMFGEHDYVKVLDFGVAKMTMMEDNDDDGEAKLTRAGRIFGTPMYMAPEQACAEPITPATDIYALGLLLFEILTGLPPVTGKNRMDVIHKQIRDEVPRLTKELKGTPIGDVIRRATRKDPLERYQDASQMWEAFYEAIRLMRVIPAPRGSSRPDISVMSLGMDARVTPTPRPAHEIAPPDVMDTKPQKAMPAPPPLPSDVLSKSAKKEPALDRLRIKSSVSDDTFVGVPDDETQVVMQALDPSVLGGGSQEVVNDTLEDHESLVLDDGGPPSVPEVLELPLIGRENELRQLQNLITQSLASRSGHILLLEGEGGVGKTRVVWALREEIFQLNIGMCVGVFRRNAAPLDALREALSDYWWVSNAPREQVESAVRADLGALNFPAEEINFLIDFLRPTSMPSYEFDPHHDASVLFAQVERILLKLAEVRPLTITLEDIQYADSATLAFLEYFAVTLRTQPTAIVFVLTLRSGERTTNSELERSLRTMSANVGVGLSRVRLKRLRGRELSVLLDAILPMESRLKERVAWLSQGNPMHAIQIIRYLKSSERLKPEQGHWVLVEGVARQIDLPPDLMDLMHLRVQQAVELNPNCRNLGETITWIAILGIRVPIALLSKVMTQEYNINAVQLDQNLQVLHKFGIVHERTHRDVRCVEFDNSLLRESLLQEVSSNPKKAKLHEVAADVKIAYYRALNQDAPLLEVAEHWRRAGDQERYRDALFDAARRSMRAQDPRGAREQFRELLRLLEGRNERNAIWAEALVSLAELSWRFGELGLSEDNYRKVIDANILKGKELAHAQRGLAHLLVMLGRFPEAVRHYRSALAASKQVQDQAGIAKALVGLSSVHLRQGSESGAGDKVRIRLEEMLPSLESGSIAGKVLLHLAESAKRNGQMQQAQEYLERSMEHYKNSSDRHGLSDSKIALAAVLTMPAEDAPKRIKRAERLLKESLEIKRTIGDRHGVAEVFRYLGGIAQTQDDLEAGENYLRQSLKMHEALGAIFNMGAACNSLAICKMYMGDYEIADALLEDAIRCFDRIGDQLAVSHVMLNKGTLAINRLQLKQAQLLLDETRELKEKLGSTWGLYDLYNHLALLAMWRGEFEQAEKLLTATLEDLNESETDEDKTIARSLLGLLRCFQGRLQLAALELGRARGDAEEMGDTKISALCQANASLYALLTEAKTVYSELLTRVQRSSILYSISPNIWLELLESMSRHALSQEPGKASERLVQTVAQLWGDFGHESRKQLLMNVVKNS